MKLLATLLFFMSLLLPFTTSAEIPKQMADDFTSLNGYIIMPIGDEYLVDLDASANLQEGDILTLVMPGEKVIHPVTKEILGTLDVPKGYLRITRIKSGYSYAKLIYSDVPPEKGDLIKRYEQVPTTFSATPANDKLFNDLKVGLPQLDWVNNNGPVEAILSFALTNNLLTVKNSSGTTLKTYQLSDGALVAPKTASFNSSIFKVDADPAANKSLLNRTVNKLFESTGLSKGNKDPFGEGIIRSPQSSKSIWRGANIEGDPVGIAVADFNADGIQETVVALESSILFIQIQNGQMKQIDSVDLPAGMKLLSLDSIDLDKNGTPELYLSAAKEADLASLAIEFDGTKFTIFKNKIPWFLRSYEFPGEGPVLLAQRLGDVTTPFMGKPFRVSRSGNNLVKGPELDLPTHANLFSFNFLEAADETQVISYINAEDYLKVVSLQGTALWESSAYFGGTETRLDNEAVNSEEAINPVYIQKRIVKTTSGEIIVPQNDGIRTMKRYRKFKNSRVVAFTWNGFAMQESWRTSEQNGYLADFTLADADNDGAEELVMAVKFKHESILNKAISTIVIYEIN